MNVTYTLMLIVYCGIARNSFFIWKLSYFMVNKSIPAIKFIAKCTEPKELKNDYIRLFLVFRDEQIYTVILASLYGRLAIASPT